MFWSTQAKPVEEAQAMRDQVLSGADMAIDYQPNDGGPWLTRLNAELQAGSGSIGVLGALHGDFSAMDDAILSIWAAWALRQHLQHLTSLQNLARVTCSTSHGCKRATSWQPAKKRYHTYQKVRILMR